MSKLVGGVYAYRCRKPGARLRIPFLSTHWGYVGQTSSFYHRAIQHEAKPWADLVVSCWRLQLPNWKWLRLTVEFVLIGLLAPVYNYQRNLWNPRRITLSGARLQRQFRDGGYRPWNLRPAHLWLIVAVPAVILAIGIARGWW